MDTIELISFELFTMYDALIKNFINGKIFVGTREQYNASYANGEIPINSLVILTDDETSGGGSSGGDSTSSTTAMLGYAVLGQMILG